MMLQSFVLAVGGVSGHRTAGNGRGDHRRASILTSRALAPVELAIGSWKGFVSARQSWGRLEALLANLPKETAQTPLPKPAKSVAVEALAVGPPGVARIIVSDVPSPSPRGTPWG